MAMAIFEKKVNLKMLRETRWSIGVQNALLFLQSKVGFLMFKNKKWSKCHKPVFC
jgi:hypothetical protein